MSNNIFVGTRDDRLSTTKKEKKISEWKDVKIQGGGDYGKFVRRWYFTTKSRAAHDFKRWSSWWRVSMWCKFWKYGTAVRNWFSCEQPDRVGSTRATERVGGGGDYGVCRRFQKNRRKTSRLPLRACPVCSTAPPGHPPRSALRAQNSRPYHPASDCPMYLYVACGH